MVDSIVFEPVYREYYPRIYRYVFSKLHDAHLTEDLTQDVLVACFKNYERFDPAKASLATWVFVIARNRLKNYYRDRKIQTPIDDDVVNSLPSEAQLLEETAVFEDTKRLLNEALSELNERERAVIEMKYLHGKQSAQIADELGMSAGNVRVLQKRTLGKIKLLLSAHGYER